MIIVCINEVSNFGFGEYKKDCINPRQIAKINGVLRTMLA